MIPVPQLKKHICHMRREKGERWRKKRERGNETEKKRDKKRARESESELQRGVLQM